MKGTLRPILPLNLRLLIAGRSYDRQISFMLTESTSTATREGGRLEQGNSSRYEKSSQTAWRVTVG